MLAGAGIEPAESSSVLPLGVAVKAKKLILGCRPRATISRRNASSTASAGTSSSESWPLAVPSAFRRSLAASPVCEECASSAITA